MSTVGGSGDDNWQRYGVVRMRFYTDTYFVSRVHGIVIDPELTAMNNSAGTAAVLSRARPGCRGHILWRELRCADSDISACIFCTTILLTG